MMILLLLVGGLAAQEDRPPPEVPEVQPPAEQEPPFRIDVNLVTLRFTVRDSEGRVLTHLQRDDFSVSEGGEPRDILFFEAPRDDSSSQDNLWLAFLIDVSGSTFATRAEEILAAQTFLDNVHRFTRVAVYGFTSELLPFQQFTSDRQAAVQAFSAARQHLGRTAIYDSAAALMAAMDRVAATGDRKVIIVVSDGLDESFQKAQSAISRARQSGVRIYTIGVPSAAQLYIGPAGEGQETEGSRALASEFKLQQEAFSRIAEETGGRHFEGVQAILNYDDVMSQISDHIFGNLYSIGYYTDDPFRDRREREIRVEVKLPGATVSELFKKLPERMEAKRQFIAALFDNEAIANLPRNLDRRFHEIGAEIDLLPARGEGTGLPFRIKISPYSLQGSRQDGIRTQLGVIGLMTDAQGKEIVRLREFFRASLNPGQLRDGRGIIYTNKLFAPPGTYDLTIALLEIPTWKMTIFEDTIRIPVR